MRNISYFCTVKCSRYIPTAVIACSIMLIFSNIRAYAQEKLSFADTDSVRISLLTCAPGTEVYSLYGHTAVRYTDYGKNIDVAINYGVFSFNKPFFVLRFIFGITDYEMGIVPFDYFCDEYRSEGRWVYQQELNLTNEEKAEMRRAFDNNFLPENRTYRYNYFYDNCTTRPRDIIIDNIKGAVVFPDAKEEYPSYRELVHSMNGNAPWARFGNDLLLGVKSDKKTDLKEQQFLPLRLMEDFEHAKIKSPDGTTRPLVIKSSYIIPAGAQEHNSGFPLSPSACAWIIFALVIIISAFELITKRKLWPFDTLLLILDGCVGIIIFLMFFSEHPTTSTNLQILLFNPLPLFFAYGVAKRAIKKRYEPLWKYAACMLVMFLIGGFFQSYAEGMYILALSLLIRCVWNIVYQNRFLPGK